MNIQAEISDVIMIETEKKNYLAPTIVNFVNGRPNDEEINNMETGVFEDKKCGKTVLALSDGKTVYKGYRPNLEEEEMRTMFAIHNKKTGRIKLVEVERWDVSPILDQNLNIDPSLEVDEIATLSEELSSKQVKRRTELREEIEINDESFKEILEDTVPTDNHEFVVPKKAIKSPDDMSAWQKSEAYFEYLGFVLAINESIKGKFLNTENPSSQIVEHFLGMLNRLDEWITQIPPVEQPQRFGNQAFRTWHSKLHDSAFEELKQVLPEELHGAILEIVEYLLEGFGNPTRIDYGTGHEMAFIMFLCCMFKIGAFKAEDKVAVALKLFQRYLEIVRRLQLTYRMEPAGSHGVWSLDDYQFVPFVWGSAQLVGHPRIEPQHFVDHGVVETFSKQYMFLGCIEFISKVKTGPFAEHSNQLWNVSAVSTWSKVNSGLIRMYKAEVLSKFPVIQHVLFGSLFSINEAPEGANCRVEQLGPPLAEPRRM